jgi:hypothetical protein
MEDQETKALRARVAELERRCAAGPALMRGIRRRSSRTLFGLPLYDIALGPDPDTGAMRGHAKGIIAIGDMATGFLALGGLARGVVAAGGLAFGLLSFGGCAIGLLAALGGAAIGGVAVGGAAAGVIAIGGGAVGHYACGGSAFGTYVISATERSPEAVDLFRPFLPWLGLNGL